jgi:hypothetical protein
MTSRGGDAFGARHRMFLCRSHSRFLVPQPWAMGYAVATEINDCHDCSPTGARRYH